MVDVIDFYFDFCSPYGYLASHRVDDLAARHGATVNWRPFLIGVAFKDTGARPLVEQGPKADYALRDFKRMARLFDVPFQLPEGFPFPTVAAARAYYWLHEQDPQAAHTLARALFDAAFTDGRNTSPPEAVADIAADHGVDRESTLAALQDPAVKQRLRQEVEAAVSVGVFGSPFILVKGEPFWGADRLEQVDRWLSGGGW